MPGTQDGAYHVAVERGVARIVARFERLPDAFFRQVELHAALSRALFQVLQGQRLLAEPHTAADGRRTSLVHCGYPPLGTGDADGAGRRPHDLVLLHPRFVHSHPLEVVANRKTAETQDLASSQPEPLLAAVRLCLVSDLTAETVDDLATQLEILARAARAGCAARCYMGLFCRHWDLEEHLLRALPALEDLAAAHEEVSLVVVQSFYDDAGHVFGGRYLNYWTHMAPLPPLGVE